jgi:hypothetical protein
MSRFSQSGLRPRFLLLADIVANVEIERRHESRFSESSGSATAVFNHKAKPPIAIDWPTVAIDRNWNGGSNKRAEWPPGLSIQGRLQNLVRDLEEQLREPK